MYTFTIARDVGGYHIETRPAVTKGGTLLRGGPEDVIVRNGGRLEQIEMFKFNALWRQLAETPKTPQGALKFVEKFGFLNYRQDGKEQAVEEITDHIESARTLVDCYEREDWGRISDWLNKANPNSIFGIGGVGKLGIVFGEKHPGERPELKFRAGSLNGAILVQYLNDVAGGTKHRKCVRPTCQIWFSYGPGTKHRETARYCSTKCQKAHAYMKHKGESE